MEQLYNSCGASARSRRGQTSAVAETAADASGKPIWMECGLRGDISSDSENESDNQTWTQMSPIEESAPDAGKEVKTDADKDVPTGAGKHVPQGPVEAKGAAVKATTVRHYEVTTDRKLKVKSIKRRKSEVSAAHIAQAQKAHESQEPAVVVQEPAAAEEPAPAADEAASSVAFVEDRTMREDRLMREQRIVLMQRDQLLLQRPLRAEGQR